MRALFLTWEFPPFIAGGLGIACYGLAKALLSLGVELDLLLPTTEDVYFPLRKEDDVDTMPVKSFSPLFEVSAQLTQTLDLREKLKRLGLPVSPESYSAPGVDLKVALDWLLSKKSDIHTREIELLKAYMMGDENTFRKVQEFTVRLIKDIPFINCDVIHAHDWLTYPAGIALKKLLHKPLVVHIHATEFDRAGGPGDNRIHNIEYAGLSAADRVIAVSQYTAQMVIDRYQINPEKVRVVHNAHSFTQEQKSKRKRLFKEPLVLFLGRVTLQKGPDYFLEIAKKVLDRHPKVRFVMAGSGDMFSRILKGAACKRLKDRFLFTGFLNRDEVEEILLATDIYLLTSVSEPFGIAPLEAMAFGAASIISKQSGVSEVINNAYKVDFWDVERTADIIVNLLENPNHREAFARAGQDEVFAMRWKEAAQKTKHIYEGVLCST